MTDHRSLVAVITGAGSGLGRRLALDLAAQGCA
ncbi:MAG: short-chain dehydrogenase, partial [Acidobacteriota bacterium]